MIWQRVARWIVAAIGIGCAGAIVLYTRSRPAPPKPPMELAKVDKGATLEAGEGKTDLFRAGRPPITLSFTATKRYDDGRQHFDTVQIDGMESSKFTVRAGMMETSAPPEGSDRPDRFNLSRGVVLTTTDGLELRSDTATYDDPTGELTMPGDVTFKKGRLSGSGLGAAYDRVRDAFTLLDGATARVEPDADGHGGSDLSSKRMILVRDQKTVQLEEDAKIVGETQTLTARTATVSFTEDEKAIKYLELRTGARVTPNPGSPPDRPAMSADNITMSFYPDGLTLQHASLTGRAVLNLSSATAKSVQASWIDLFTASDGRTLTRLQGKDKVIVTLAATATAPGKTITSTVLSATGDDKKGLTSARFEGGPRFEEVPVAGARRAAGPGAAPSSGRTGTATTLVLTLGGQIDAIERAEFQQNATFQDGDMTALADVAQYEEASGLLHLLPNPKEPRRLSRVTTSDMTVDGSTIDVDTNSNDLHAQGTVTTRLVRAPGSVPESKGALFAGDEPIVGGADTLRYTKSTGTAFYTGSARGQARLKQGQSEVVGDQVEFVDSSRNLNASGRVDSTWMLASSSGAPADSPLKPYRVRAETLQYDEAARTAVYRGSRVVMNTTDSDVEAGVLTFRIASESRALESMRAQQAVWTKMSGGYEAIGDVLVYRADTDLYTLEGKAGQETAQVKSPRADSQSSKTPMCNLNDGMRLELDRKTGQVRVPGGGQAPQNVTDIACSVSLRRAK